MKFDISYRNLPKAQHDKIQDVIETYAGRHLRPSLEAFAGKELRLRVTLEKRKLDYRVTCRMQLPGRRVIVAQGANGNLDEALHEAFLELTRQAERQHARLSHQSSWRRKARRQRIRQLKNAPVNAVRQQVEVSLGALLPRLETWIRHELAYLRASGLLAEDYPTFADVRDEMYVRIQSNWEELPHDETSLLHAAMRVIHRILDEEQKRAGESAAMVSLEEAVPEDAEEQAEDMVEEEVGEFYQPDEDLHVEDLIADTEIATPDQQLDPEAVDACHEILGALPTLWRRTLTLARREGIPVDTAADILAIDTNKAREVLTVGELYATERLEERGFSTADLSVLCRA